MLKGHLERLLPAIERELADARKNEDRLVREIADQLTTQALERVGA